jgi:phage tail-like protein
MPSYFDKKLIDLLPDLYRESDKTGDLETFLKIPAATLDEIKLLADRFPEIFDVDQCEDRFLPFLGEIVGHRFDPFVDAAVQRRLIREAVEIYRRKGTIPAVGRSLSAVGWQGRIDETFRKALRLNRRSTVGRAKLPGMIYSLGVYRIESDNIVQGVRSGLDFHHPAGTKVFFLQWLCSLLSMESDFEAVIKKVVERVCLGHLHETFAVNHNALNTDYHLTRKNKTWGLWRITHGTTLMQDVEHAAVYISRWHGRRPQFRLNTGNLNEQRLPNLWISERRAAFCCEIKTKPQETPAGVFIRLAGQDLNRSRLNRSTSACRVKFRQKDDYAEALAGFDIVANLVTVTQWPTA